MLCRQSSWSREIFLIIHMSFKNGYGRETEKTAYSKANMEDTIFLFLLFFGCVPGMRKLPGQGLNPSHSSDNAGSLTYWARPGTEPATSWFLVRFVNHWATMGTPFCPFFNWVVWFLFLFFYFWFLFFLFCFLLLSCVSYLYTLAIKPLSVTSIETIFYHSLGCLFFLWFPLLCKSF